MVKLRVLKEESLTVFEVSGTVTEEEIADAISHFWRQPEQTRNTLWDFRNGDMSQLDADRLREAVMAGRQVAPDRLRQRRGGAIGFVATEDLEFGMARMAAAFLKLAGHPMKPCVFRTLPEAMKWLHSTGESEGDGAVPEAAGIPPKQSR